MLSVLIDYDMRKLDHVLLQAMDSTIRRRKGYHVELNMLKSCGAVSDGIFISSNELQDSLADYTSYLAAKMVPEV